MYLRSFLFSVTVANKRFSLHLYIIGVDIFVINE
jgi:hypothetical protein